MSFHPYKSKLDLEHLKIKSLPCVIRKTLTSFEEHLIAQGESEGRVLKYLYTLRKIYQWLGKPFEEATRIDIEKILLKLEEKEYSPWTKQSYKVILKYFYKWLRGSEEYPKEVSWIKTNIKRSQEKLPTELLTREDVLKMIHAAKNIRDKALLMLLYESGGRISEIGTMKIKDVEFKENYAVLTLRGKTGIRKVPVVASLPYIQNWVNNHPIGKPDTCLWVSIGSSHHLQPLSYSHMRKIVQTCAARAKIKKRVYCHLFRHSRATELATKLTEYQLCLYFGWTVGSRVVREYVRRSGRDLNNTILNLYGIEEKQAEEKIEEIHKCPRCGSINRREALYCYQCSSALDVQTALQAEQTVQKASKIITTLYKILEKIYEQDKEKFKPLLPDLQALLQFSEQNSEQNQQHPPTAPHESTQPDA